MPAPQKEELMELTTSWKEEGRAEGRVEGRAEGRRQEAMELILRQLNRRFGALPSALTVAVEALPLPEIERLGEDLLDFTSPADLERWVHRR